MIPNNRITLLLNGEGYFPAIEAAIDNAMHNIYLETYIFKDDPVGRRIADALRRAALRGVATHVLIDGFGSFGFSKMLHDDLAAAGVRVWVFRVKTSPRTFRRRRLRRLHRKIVVADRKIAFVGGINIVDDMDGPGRALSPRYDYAVRVEGPLVAEIDDSARRVWSRATRTRLGDYRKRDVDGPAPSTESSGSVRAAFLVRDNIRHHRDIENAYLRAIERAKSEIILANAFFLPGLTFRRALLDAVRRGVRVRLLLQGRSEYRWVHQASHALYGRFLDAGIEIHEYRKSLMHAKVAVIDGRWATVGSSNLDPFSLLLSLEANIAIEDETFADALRRDLKLSIDRDSRRILPNRWRSRSFRMRLESRLSYALVRCMIGISGYAPNKQPGPMKTDA